MGPPLCAHAAAAETDGPARGVGKLVNFFERLKNGIIDDSIVTKTVKDYSQNAECWCKKGTEGTLMPVVEDKLMPLLNNALEERRRQYSRWQ